MGGRALRCHPWKRKAWLRLFVWCDVVDGLLPVSMLFLLCSSMYVQVRDVRDVDIVGWSRQRLFRS